MCTGGTGQAQEKCIGSAGWLPDQVKGTCWRLEKGRGVGLRTPLARGEPACRAPHGKATESLSGEEIGKLCRPAGSWTAEKK